MKNHQTEEERVIHIRPDDEQDKTLFMDVSTSYYLRLDHRARIISWRFSVNIFWNAMHLAQKVDHESWIQEVQHLPLERKIYIRAIIGDCS